MTSTGEDPHPEVSELSDWSEGLLPPEREAAVREHVDGCGLCADVVVSLEEIRGLLGTLPGEPMPADVAVRIDAALAAETVLDAGSGSAPEAPSVSTVEPTLPHVPRGTSTDADATTDTESGTGTGTGAGTHVPRGTSTDADATTDTESGTGTGTGTGTHVSRGTSPTAGSPSAAPSGPDAPHAAGAPGGRPHGATGPGRTGSTRSGLGGRGARRRRRLLAGGYAAAVLALGGIVYGAVEAGGSSSGAGADSATAKTHTAAGTGSVAASVRELLAQQPGQDGAAGSRDNSPMLSKTPHPDVAPAGPTAVPSCVLNATHRTQQPIASEREVFQGLDAYLVVLPHPADSSQVDAFVVSASCTPAAPGTVLFQGTYAR